MFFFSKKLVHVDNYLYLCTRLGNMRALAFMFFYAQ